jgi:molybdopterin-binding protein
MPKLVTPKQAAARLAVSYPTLKKWIYAGKIRTLKTSGGHHRVPEEELDRFLHLSKRRSRELPRRREHYRRISGRNQLIGRVVEVKISGLMAQVKLSIGGQIITSIVTAEAAQEMQLKVGETAAALIKSTEVMIVRP